MIFVPKGAQAEAIYPAAIDVAKQILEVTNAAALGDQFAKQIITSMSAGLNAANPGRGSDVEALLDQIVVPELHRTMPELLDATAHVYASTFSAAELNQILAFYRSDIGRKMIEKTPTLLQEQGRVAQALVRKMMPDLQTKLLNALSARGLKKPDRI
jgi:hypothetical protein